MEKDALPSLNDLGTLANKVYAVLEGAILAGKLKQGDRLVEEELAAMLGVSRGPVREALRMMEKDGLVKLIPRKGAVVNSISPEDLAEIYEVAVVLEELTVNLFCRRATEEEIEALEKICAEMREEMQRGNVAQYRVLNRQFHEVLICGSRNKRLIDLYKKLRKQIFWFQNVSPDFPIMMERWLEEHQRIIDFLRKRDAAAAGKMASNHLRKAAQAFLRKEQS